MWILNSGTSEKTYYSQTCLMWPSQGTVKYGHIRQVVA
jgi:hypothetical protein